MAHRIGLESIRIAVGPRLLLDDVTLGIEDGLRVGVLGPNGAGKSTLLAALAGVREVDGGRVTRAGGTRVAMLRQTDNLPGAATVRRAVHGGAPEHEWASDPAVRDIHAGLLADIDPGTEVAALSGGQRRRVALAAVLTSPADVLLLDEPTNHLDVEGVDWLARHLNARFASRRSAGALVVVTHDRWFLDAICTNVWEVVPGVDPGGGRAQTPGRIETYDGGYAAYVLARAERARQAAVAAAKRENLLRKELAWLRRGAPARTSKPRFRIEAAEALIADVPPPRDTVELVRMATARLGKDVIDVEDVSVSFTRPDGAALTILRDVTWRLAPAERVGIVGVNGAGKTTILNLLRGDLEPTSGRVRRGKTVQIATLSQDTHELDALADMRVVEAVADVAHSVVVDGKEVSASQMTERMGFTRARAYTRIGEISGGERRRLQLMRLLMSQPNVLLLDEPTNDLDTDTLASMEDLLDTFPGTLVVVSHDRYLLERVTDHQVALLGDGQIRALPGGVEQYLQMRASGDFGAFGTSTRADEADPASRSAASSSGASSGEESAGRGNARGAVSDAAARRAAKKDLARIERKLDRLRAEASDLEAKLEKLSIQVATDPSAVSELTKVSAAHQDVLAEMGELEDAWLEAADLLE